MKRLILLTAAFVFLSFIPASAENYLLNGGQDSTIRYTMTQSVTPTPGTLKLSLSYVKPQTYLSPTYKQQVESADIRFSVDPDSRTTTTDENGNTIICATWNSPGRTVNATVACTVRNSVTLGTLKTSAPFPLSNLPSKTARYLAPTKQVPSTDPMIKQKAADLTRASKTEFDAVQKILSWVVDHMRYVQRPESFDGMYAFKTGRGNCQNYSHLSAALMRAAGIPVRIVNGVTLKKPYEIKQKNGTLVIKNAKGRHSWIEVYFPDLKWVPFDPQCTELFVSNRFIRVEVGIDNNDTENDGLIRWTRVKGSTGKPGFREDISADFVTDKVTLVGTKTSYGPKNNLFAPPVLAAFEKKPVVHEKPLPVKINPKQLKLMSYTVPFLFGNLDFPAHLDFQSAHARIERSPDGTMKMVKSFLVETAQYVTTRGKKYAQSFILKKPLKLSSIGLALHNFGSGGQIWVELLSDKNGVPDRLISTSDPMWLEKTGYLPGYSWFDFSFADENIILPPGRYWAALGFTGGPIVNWFFTYGKPTGPQDGTRYRTLFDDHWSHSLAFEFNYRVKGFAPKSF